MKHLFLAVLGASVTLAPMAAACDAGGTFPLDGTTVVLATCDPDAAAVCIEAEELLARYNGPSEDDDPTVLTVGIQSSPWRLYGAGYRILDVAELAEMLRPHLKPEVRAVRLRASWAGFVPQGRTRSLAQELSSALTHVDVAAPQGFLWFTPEGEGKVTRQSFTALQGPIYMARPGEEIMGSAVAFMPAEMETYVPAENMGEFKLRRGLSEDVFDLCPDSALSAFREAGALGNPIGAYNAAVMLLERNGEGDRDDARALLSRAAESGDAPSQALLTRTFGT
jgi:hypothetical protein